MMKKQLKSGRGFWMWGVLGIFVLLVITGCEGSGSSGFDNNPRLVEEQAVLARINSTKGCTDMEGIKICSFDAYDKRGKRIIISPPITESVSCVIGRVHACELKMNIISDEGESFLGQQFIVAVRYYDPFVSEWTVVAHVKSEPFEAVVPLKLSAENGANVDWAVLSYVNLDPATTLPLLDTKHAVLVDFKPSLAFVASNITVVGSTGS